MEAGGTDANEEEAAAHAADRHGLAGRAVLGIETSCDETAAAVLDLDGRVLAEAVLSQFADHAPYGGVVPEIAARAHLRYLPAQVAQVMDTAGVTPAELAGVAATTGPGLIGGLIVGCQFGKGLALGAGKPFLAINHLEAHALTARLPGLTEGGAPFPYLLMLLSGGHSQCIAVRGVGDHVRLGGTVDDAAGEAFDKVAKLLGLGWPGGPALERLAADGDSNAFPLPRPMLRRPGCDFSFSGLKTAVAQIAAAGVSGQRRADLAASFQRAVTDVMADRAAHAMAMMRERHPEAGLLVVAGGVAANAAIRAALARAAEAQGFRLVAPPLRLCSDNAVMVAWAGIERLRLGVSDGMAVAPRPRWPLAELIRPPVPA
jgi:N6-L-threonylcarbamoyladenine synthase